MADTQVKRSTSKAQLKRLRLNPHLRLRVYETLFHLNRGLTLTVTNLDRMATLGLFRRDYLRAYRNMAEELRALTNTRLLATLRDVESAEAFRFQNLRLRWLPCFYHFRDIHYLHEIFLLLSRWLVPHRPRNIGRFVFVRYRVTGCLLN